MFVGACVGMAFGATLGFPGAFKAVAIPGILLGIAALRLRVPPERTVPVGSPHPGEMLRDGLRLLRIPTLRWMLPAGILISFAAGGYIDWIVDFTVNHKGIPKAQAIPIYFAITVTGGGLGVVVAGWIADRWQSLHDAGRAYTMAIGFAGAVPFAILVVVLGSGWQYFLCGWFILFFLPWYNGPMVAIIDEVVDDADAGTAQATFIFFLHLLGTGPGGFVLGLVSKYYTLRYAFYLPAAAIAGAALCAWKASQHVTADIARRQARVSRPPARLAACVASSS